ncbi:MAG: hypothetical protein ACE5O2_10620 [Armatimonadota bacterium]
MYVGHTCRELNVRHREHKSKPFFPLMIWLQSPARIPDGLSIGVNTFVGNGGDMGNKEFLDLLAENGLYGVFAFDQEAVGHSHLLGWIHGDEPDLRKRVSDADVGPGEGLILNPNTPLWRIVDGVKSSWSVLDPLEGAEVTIRLKAPVTVQSLAVWLTVSGDLSVAKDVAFFGDGKEILTAVLEKKRGQQRFALQEPATFSQLAFKVRSVYPGGVEYGSVSEIEAFDRNAENVLLSRPRNVPRRPPEEIAPYYRKIKETAPTRPVFVTFTSAFMQDDGTYDEATRKALYSQYVRYCDVAGFDIYPIFGWNRPAWLDRVAEGVSDLCAIAGPRRPVYAWIEANTGSKWITPSVQIPLKPMHTRAEVWMAIIRGATAIGYFTHRWKPDYRQFAPEPEMVAELKRLNQQITKLAPAILADPARVEIDMSMSDDLPCHFKATQFDGALYIFAQNTDLGPNKDNLRQGEDIRPRAGEALIRVEGLKAGTRIEVLNEGRTLTAEDGQFSDRFAPLAEHAYRLSL